VPTSPSITCTRRATSSSNASLPPSWSRRRSKQLFLKISRWARCSHVAHATGPDQQHQLAVGHRAQEPLHQCGAEEAGGTGDGDALPGQVVGDHPGCLPLGREPVRAWPGGRGHSGSARTPGRASSTRRWPASPNGAWRPRRSTRWRPRSACASRRSSTGSRRRSSCCWLIGVVDHAVGCRAPRPPGVGRGRLGVPPGPDPPRAAGPRPRGGPGRAGGPGPPPGVAGPPPRPGVDGRRLRLDEPAARAASEGGGARHRASCWRWGVRPTWLTDSTDCEDLSSRSALVLGCWSATLNVTHRLTGFVPFARLVRSGLPAPARPE
jgi:hypothetical protein